MIQKKIIPSSCRVKTLDLEVLYNILQNKLILILENLNNMVLDLNQAHYNNQCLWRIDLCHSLLDFKVDEIEIKYKVQKEGLVQLTIKKDQTLLLRQKY